MNIQFITFAEVKMIHVDQINRYGGMHGLRDENLLDSAVNYPRMTFDQKYLQPDIYYMAAGYMCSIIKNHPFIDGNKRTGFIVAILFLANNNIFIAADQDELFNLTIAIAESKISEKEVAIFFKKKAVEN